MSREPASDVENRDEAPSNVRDALAPLQQAPAAALDESKHETLCGMVDNASTLERSLSNEIDQLRGEQ